MTYNASPCGALARQIALFALSEQEVMKIVALRSNCDAGCQHFARLHLGNGLTAGHQTVSTAEPIMEFSVLEIAPIIVHHNQMSTRLETEAMSNTADWQRPISIHCVMDIRDVPGEGSLHARPKMISPSALYMCRHLPPLGETGRALWATRS
jgi:hypothetical protein